MTFTVNQMAELAEAIEREVAGSKAELTGFPGGGAMLDVRRVDNRSFVMAFTPSHGFGVDEVREDDGFVTGYRFAFSEFAPAADQLRELLSVDTGQRRSNHAIALNLVVIYSRDVEAAKEFYGCLGMTFKPENHGSGPRHYAAELGTTVFEIYPCRSQSTEAALRLGFCLSSVDGALELLQRQNAKIVSQPEDTPWGRRSVVKDPDGNKVELTQEMQTQDQVSAVTM
jgi:lactoylglutathione lyase